MQSAVDGVIGDRVPPRRNFTVVESYKSSRVGFILDDEYEIADDGGKFRITGFFRTSFRSGFKRLVNFDNIASLRNRFDIRVAHQIANI